MCAQEETLCRRTSALQDPISLEEHRVGGAEISGLKLTPSCSHSLSRLLFEIHAS